MSEEKENAKSSEPTPVPPKDTTPAKPSGTTGEVYDKPAEVKSIYFPNFFKEIPSQVGKTVVITGTTSGTGYVAARTAALKGAKVVMLNRKSKKAQDVLASLRELVEKSSAENKGEIEWVECDLMDFDSVRKAAEEVAKMCPEGVDVLCNNAGVMALEDKATKDGYDLQVQTNHLSHFLLTKELFPLLTKAAEEKGEARVVTHSSSARSKPPWPFMKKYFEKRGGNLGGDSPSMVFGGRFRRYQQSKLANSLFTIEFQKRLDAAGSKVKAFAAIPGRAATDLQVTTNKRGGMSGGFTQNFMKKSQSAEDGTMGILTGMFLPDVEKGAMYGPVALTGPAVKIGHGMLSTYWAARTLWGLSEDACGKFDVTKK